MKVLLSSFHLLSKLGQQTPGFSLSLRVQALVCNISVRLCLRTSQVAHQTGAYPGFSSIKRLGVFLLPPGWDASPSQGHSQH